MKREAARIAIGLSVAMAAASSARADGGGGEEETAQPRCGEAAGTRAPDPRCGETLDGRSPPQTPAALAVPRLVLWVPRVASRVVLWPVVETSDFVEHRNLPGWLEAILTTDDGLVGVRPIVQYATGFLPTAGLRVFYRRLPGPGSELSTRFQTAGPSVFHGEAAAVGPAWLGLGLRAVWDHRDDRLFAGIGANSAGDLAAQGRGLSRFGSDVLMAEARWSRRLPWRTLAGVHADVQRRDYQASSVRGGPSIAELYPAPPGTCTGSNCVDPALVPGFQNGLRIGHVGAGLAWDLRSHARDGGGVSLAFDSTYGQGIAGDPSRHVMFSGETVLALGGVDRALMLRGRAAMVQALDAAPIPFEELVMPTGIAGMRGFPEGRFRGESGLVGTAEYRWYIAHNLDASLFTDVGTVAGHNFSGLRRDRWFPSFGVGLRLYKTPGPYWEGDVETGVQLAYAPDGGFRVLLAVAAF